MKKHYRPENFEARRSVGYLIKRLNSLSMPRLEALFGNEELTFSHWIALMALRDGLAHTCADIARHMSHDSGATTRLVDQLEARGLLTRQRSKDDRRVVELSLTPSGRNVVRTLMPHVIDFWNGALEEFSPEEFETLVSLLARLAARIEREPEMAEPALLRPLKRVAK